MRTLVVRPVIGALICLASAPASAAPTVDDIVAKSIAAQGGDAKLAALTSLRLTGTALLGGGDFAVNADWGLLVSQGRIRQEFSLQGLTQILAYDGKGGWRLDPFGGRREAEKMGVDEARALAVQTELVAPLYEAKKRGYKLELLADEDVDGTPAIAIRATRKDGDSETVFLDHDTYLPLRVRLVLHVRGTENISDTDLGGYDQVAGVWLPMSIEIGDTNGNRFERVTVQHAEANVTAGDDAFATTTTQRTVVAAKNAPALANAAPPAASETAPVLDGGTISGLGARNIGSATMGGRVSAVAGRVEDGKTTLFVGAASGGVWRSLDGGTTFTPVFDKQPVQSIGAITIDPSSDGKTIWVGTGESWTRNSVSIGDGIYKSTDGGTTWTNMGLHDSERITRILVNPKNPNTVWACVPGKLWSDSKDRGIYKTTDGGKTWALQFAPVNASTGCSSLQMDPKNPDVLLAGTWDFRRKAWTFRSGGDGPDAASGSSMYRTVDGGAHWQSIAKAKGLPAQPWGRVELAIAPSDSKTVYALVESKQSSLYRSTDGGQTWEARDHSTHMVWRPFYFARLIVDPKDANRVFKPDLTLIVSDDGGGSFSPTGGGSHGDWHDLWIDPTNPKHIVGGDDGGLWLSYDGGTRWWRANNLPVSQFYHVSVDDKDPYNVYGGLQDNSTWVGPSAYPGGITNSRWENLYGGDGFWAIPDPSDPDAVYCESQGGYIGRVDRKTLTARDIQPKAGYKEKLRFNWNSPIAVSPTNKKTLYLGSQFLFRSRDRGETWDRISPDLSTNDPDKQKQEQSGGVTIDNSSAEMHTTIYSISESPKDGNVIWVGTDDGNVQVTRDAGKAWTNVVANVPGLPKASWVSWVEASRFDAGTAYAAFDRHTVGDMTPWVYRTTDYGKTWTRIVSPDQGVKGYAHVIKEDTVEKRLLFVGTELGLWISLDGGSSWAQFKGGNFPAVAVREVQVQARDNDLVMATHGRGIWIIDDLTPLRALSAQVLAKQTAFLPGRPIQQRMQANGGWAEGDASYAGDNPSGGAVVAYYLRTRHVYGPIKLEVLDAKGALVDTIPAPKRRGVNRVVWNMQVKPPRVPKAAQVAGSSTAGPRVVPGTYTLRLTRGKDVIETKVNIGLDRRATYSVADRKAQFDEVMKAHALFGDMTDLADKLDGLRGEIADRTGKVKPDDALAGKLKSVAGKLEALKKLIVATTEGGAITGEERIREHLDTDYGAMLRWEGKPTPYQVQAVATLKKELDEVAKDLAATIASDVRPLDDELKKRGLAPIPVAVVAPAHALDEVEIECVRSLGLECERVESTAERD